jgi:hypothetical protein
MQDVVAAEVPEAAARLVGRLRRLDLEPLLEPLTRLLAAAPDDAALREWAARRPDQWVAAIRGLATIVGYAERREVDVSVTINVNELSDSMLEAALAAQMAKLGLAAGEHSELRQLPVPDTSASSA